MDATPFCFTQEGPSNRPQSPSTEQTGARFGQEQLLTRHQPVAGDRAFTVRITSHGYGDMRIYEEHQYGYVSELYYPTASGTMIMAVTLCALDRIDKQHALGTMDNGHDTRKNK